MSGTGEFYTVERGDDPAGDVWVSLFGWDVHIIKTDEGIVVDVWDSSNDGTGDPEATTYAFDADRMSFVGMCGTCHRALFRAGVGVLVDPTGGDVCMNNDGVDGPHVQEGAQA